MIMHVFWVLSIECFKVQKSRLFLVWLLHLWKEFTSGKRELTSDALVHWVKEKTSSSHYGLSWTGKEPKAWSNWREIVSLENTSCLLLICVNSGGMGQHVDSTLITLHLHSSASAPFSIFDAIESSG